MSNKQANYLIDISILLQFLRKKRYVTGIPRVVLTYIKHYAGRCQLVYYSRILGTIVILPPEASLQAIRWIEQWDYSLYPSIMRLFLRHGKWQFLSSKQYLNDYFIKICMRDISSPWYFWRLRQLGVKLVVMVHDLIPIIYPELVSPVSTKRFKTGILRLLDHARGVVTVSETERKNLIQYLASLGRAIPPIIAAPLASGLVVEKIQYTSQRMVQGPYFVIVGPISDRKNHRLLFDIWSDWVEKKQKNIPKLLVLGKLHRTKEPLLTELLQQPSLQPYVFHMELGDNALINYVSFANALLFPSFAEGYGLPLAEALTLGTPTIVNDLPVFREIGGDIPEYIPVQDKQAWADMILEYTKPKSTQRAQQVQRIAHFVVPTWDTHFARFDKFLTTL
mgnify:CR=1 FL=1